MPRRRLGVALVVDPPVADQIDGLRRALGDPTLGRIAPHLTLVPPVNVKEEHLAVALAILRAAASGCSGPIELTLGAPATFLPDNPVVFLPVGGDLDELRTLRDGVFRGPLERQLSWPWVPHVTVADGIAEERARSAVECLAGYCSVVRVDRVVLLEEVGGRMWTEVADSLLRPPFVVGTGGLPIEITAGRLIDPEGLDMLAADHGADLVEPASLVSARLGAPMVHTARREGSTVGVAAAWLDREGPHVWVHVRAEARHQGVGTHLLRSVESAAAVAGWKYPELQADGPAGFYLAAQLLVGGHSKATEEYRESFFRWWRASIRLTVPDFDRITSDSVDAPRPS